MDAERKAELELELEAIRLEYRALEARMNAVAFELLAHQLETMPDEPEPPSSR